MYTYLHTFVSVLNFPKQKHVYTVSLSYKKFSCQLSIFGIHQIRADNTLYTNKSYNCHNKYSDLKWVSCLCFDPTVKLRGALPH